jgi:hypothetical protein
VPLDAVLAEQREHVRPANPLHVIKAPQAGQPSEWEAIGTDEEGFGMRRAKLSVVLGPDDAVHVAEHHVPTG